MGAYVEGMGESEGCHDGYAVFCHGAFSEGFVVVILVLGGLARLPIAAEVDGYHCVVLGERGSDPVPDVVGLGEAMEEEQRWFWRGRSGGFGGVDAVDFQVWFDGDLEGDETLEHLET